MEQPLQFAAFAPPDSFRTEDALGCGEHAERVTLSLVTGDWGWVDQLPEPASERSQR